MSSQTKAQRFITRRQFLKKLGLAGATTGLLLPSLKSFASTPERSFPDFDKDNICILIGDLGEGGPNSYRHSVLRQRIQTAEESGADSVLLVANTRYLENTYESLDRFIEKAGMKGLGMIPRLTVDSRSFTDRIQGDPEVSDSDLPDYTNQGQLDRAKEILRKTILHLENFENIIGYQVEWGHWGESWINSAFWDSRSARKSFEEFLLGTAPTLAYLDFDWWWQNEDVEGQIIFYSKHFSDGNPLSDKTKVLQFYWYQYWRNKKTREITWDLRCTATNVTNKAIIGFSYPGTATNSYCYTADRCTDIAFSAKPSNPNGPNRYFIRDGGFNGLQLVELDFDTPYLKWERRNEIITDSYRKGITPIIFYPHWSKNLDDNRVNRLVDIMKRSRSNHAEKENAGILVVVGNNDVGYADYVLAPYISVANWASTNPPGFLPFLEQKGIDYDIVDASAYTPEIGGKYESIAVFTPYDKYTDGLLNKFYLTETQVCIFFPSFIVGGPTTDSPFTTTSAIYGMKNALRVGNKRINHMVYGSQPMKITFQRGLARHDNISNYQANHLLSYYEGDFNEVLSEITINDKKFTFMGKTSNLYFIGADLQVNNDKHRAALYQVVSNIMDL